MKKILTVLLALSVVFTYSFATVGTAFASTDTTAKENYEKAVADAKEEIAYSGETTQYLVTNGGKYDGLIEKGTVNDQIEELSNVYAADKYASAPQTAQAFLDALFEQSYSANKSSKIEEGKLWSADEHKDKLIVFTEKDKPNVIIAGPISFETQKKFIEYWKLLGGSDKRDAYLAKANGYRYESLLKAQRATDQGKASDLLNFDPVGMGYTEDAVKKINKLIAAQKEEFDDVTSETADNAAIKAYQDIIAAIEAVIEKAETDEDIADDLDEAEKAVQDAIEDKSEAFINVIQEAKTTDATELAKQASVISDTAELVSYFEDRVDRILADDSMKDSDKAKALKNLIKAVKKTFDTKKTFRAYLYEALDVLADSELFETYAYNVAAEKKAERNADGTVKFYAKDVDEAYEAALEGIIEAVDTAISKGKTLTSSSVRSAIDKAFNALQPMDYELQGVKEKAIGKITTTPYDASAWDGERQEKVIAIQEQATEDILNAETVAEVDELVEKAQADMDAILTIDQIEKLTERINTQLDLLDYEKNFRSYYDIVTPSTGYSAATKTDAVEDAKDFLIEKVLEKEDAELTSTEIKTILTENYTAALDILENVLSDAELAAQATALDTAIAALPKVVAIEDKDDILTVWENVKAYDELAGASTDDLKNYKDLEDAYDDLVDLEKDAVRDQIRAIPTVITVADKETIENARAAADALYDTYEVKPTNMSKLIDAEAKLEEAKLKDAIDKVSALGSDPTQAEVEAARAAYDALNTVSKLKFNAELYEDLLKAEDSLGVNIINSVTSLKVVKNHSTAGRTNGKSWLKIMWSTVGDDSHVDGYEIYKSTKKNSGYKHAFTTKNPENKWYKNTAGLKKGTMYYYKVRAFVEVDGQKYYSDWSNKAYRKAK